MYDTLFALLRAALHGGDIPEVPNFCELLGEARKQTVDGLLYALPEISVVLSTFALASISLTGVVISFAKIKFNKQKRKNKTLIKPPSQANF